MFGYALRRLLYVVPISLGVTILVFALVHLAPGDPLNAVVAPDAPASVVAKLKADYGFDQASARAVCAMARPRHPWRSRAVGRQ